MAEIKISKAENWHKRIWLLAGPIILSNLSVPLLGAVDTAVVGHLPDPVYLGAVAIGAMIFSFLYWGFGFLRMGTTGLTAQAWGANNKNEVTATLYRSLMLALLIGIPMIALQWPISYFAFQLIDASASVETSAKIYFSIRIWSAPATLANYVVMGWFLGRQNSRIPLIINLWTNGLNITLDIVFVVWLGMDVDGVALATVIAEVSGVLLGLLFVMRHLQRDGLWGKKISNMINTEALWRLFHINRDLFIRTTCLIFAFAYFTNQSAKLGNEILAINAVLLIFLEIAAYGLDGFAHATEALVGRAVGRNERHVFQQSVRVAMIWSAGFACLFAIGFLTGGEVLINLLTNIPEIREGAYDYLVWVALMPLISCWCFTFDGIFLGATRSHEMRNGMLISIAVYIASVYIFKAEWGNDGLWAAMMVFMAMRGLTLARVYPRVLRSVGLVN